MKRAIYIGFDKREIDAVEVCLASIRNHLSIECDISLIPLDDLRHAGLYQRPTEVENGELFDVISNAPMSTEFAISRFFVPILSETAGYDAAVFLDCDMLVRADMAELFAMLDPDKAIQVVQHDYEPAETVKMDNRTQTSYERKNWSSVMLWNLNHPATRLLTIEKLNSWAGRALHQFKWLEDSEIGALPKEWNHLVGVYAPDPDARIVHFTLGIPSMAGYENSEHADEWRAELQNVR